MKNQIITGMVEVYQGCKGNQGKKEAYMQMLHYLEIATRRFGKECLKETLQEIEKEREEEYCPKGHRGIRQRVAKPRRYKTKYGEIEISRQEFYCPECNEYFYPLDYELGVDKDCEVTIDLQEVISRNSARMSYTDSIDNIKRDYGVEVSQKQAEDVVKRVARRIKEKELYNGGKFLDYSRVYIQTDGILIRSREEGKKHQEVRVGMSFSKVVDIKKRREIWDKEYVASVDKEGFCEKFWRRLVERKIWKAKEIVFCGDSAPYIDYFYKEYIQKRLKSLCIFNEPKLTRFLDVYHLRSKLTKRLGEMGYFDGERYTEIWNLLWRGESGRAIEEIKKLEPENLEGREAQVKLIGYIERNKEWIVNYEELKKQGYILGSGAVEKANDNLVAKRMKKKGMSWRQQGAEVILKLRLLMANKRWDTFWWQEESA